MMMNDRRFVEVIVSNARIYAKRICIYIRMYVYMYVRPNESADHRNPYPACTKRALRGTLYAGRKIAITIVFQQFVTCGIESYRLCRFKWILS